MERHLSERGRIGGFRGSRIALAAAAFAAPCGAYAEKQASAPPVEAGKALTDAEVLAAFKSRWDPAAMMFKRVPIGTHNGLRLVADFPCSDVCPQNTRRIIHYDVAADKCDEVGGRLNNEWLPIGVATVRRAFCEPAVLVPISGQEWEHNASRWSCPSGSVPRLAGPDDGVCAKPEARARSREENIASARLRDPKGAFGPASCISGYVWREAFEGDQVCVPPSTRSVVAQENASERCPAAAGPQHLPGPLLPKRLPHGSA
jgi:hypothetical protein